MELNVTIINFFCQIVNIMTSCFGKSKAQEQQSINQSIKGTRLVMQNNKKLSLISFSVKCCFNLQIYYIKCDLLCVLFEFQFIKLSEKKLYNFV